MTDKLLTIAIPTYNRASYLDTCLLHITQQMCGYESLVEIIVSDNCSSDNTLEVAKSYYNNCIDFRYIKNDDNIGVDRNFVQCFSLANGKYVLILGDDDILLDGALAKIITILQKGEYGVVYLNSFWFKNDYLTETPAIRKDGVIYCQSPEQFLQQVNYWITFASGNICNKSLLPLDFDPSKYIDTNLVQVYWYFSSLLAAKQNVYISEQVIAAKAGNSDGYSVCKVFGPNLNMIMNDMLVDIKYKPVIRYINNLLLCQFLPGFILNIRKKTDGYSFEDQNIYEDIMPLYKSYVNFWLYLVPVIKLPLPVASMWYFIIKLVNKIKKLI